MGTKGRCRTWTALLVFVIVGVSTPAEAFELSGGVGLGGILAGTVPHLTVSPHAALSWSMSNGLLFGAHEIASILVSPNKDGVGVYETTSAVIGYTSDKRNFSVGPSLSLFSIPACGARVCGRVAGVAPGGHAQVNAYFYGRLGVAVNASLDWARGRSLALPGGLAAMVVAGPVLQGHLRVPPNGEVHHLRGTRRVHV